MLYVAKTILTRIKGLQDGRSWSNAIVDSSSKDEAYSWRFSDAIPHCMIDTS
jgi:hypothetical protein